MERKMYLECDRMLIKRKEENHKTETCTNDQVEKQHKMEKNMIGKIQLGEQCSTELRYKTFEGQQQPKGQIYIVCP